jgi:hypothetical protein
LYFKNIIALLKINFILFRFVKVLQNNFLVTEDQIDKFEIDLHKNMKHGNKCLSCDGNSMHTTSLPDSLEIGKHMLVFYNNLELRAKQNEDVIKHDAHMLSLSAVATRRASRKASRRESKIIGISKFIKKTESRLIIQATIEEGEDEGDDDDDDDDDDDEDDGCSSSGDDSDSSYDSDEKEKHQNDKKLSKEEKLGKSEIRDYLKCLKINLKNQNGIK